MAEYKEYTFGTCDFDRITPPNEKLSPSTRTMNIIVPFEEALKFALAVDECIHELNRYKKSTKEGKRVAMNLTVHLQAKRIAINKGKLKKKAQ